MTHFQKSLQLQQAAAKPAHLTKLLPPNRQLLTTPQTQTVGMLGPAPSHYKPPAALSTASSSRRQQQVQETLLSRGWFQRR
jgi:hypothetical protein